MNTFLNMQQEFHNVKWLQDEKQKRIKNILTFSLTNRIFLRGITEQWGSRVGIFGDTKKRISSNITKSLLLNINYLSIK